jgi:hypothetical protein
MVYILLLFFLPTTPRKECDMTQPFSWKQFMFGTWYRALISIVLIVALIVAFSFVAIMIFFAIFVMKLVAGSLLNIFSAKGGCRCR